MDIYDELHIEKGTRMHYSGHHIGVWIEFQNYITFIRDISIGITKIRKYKQLASDTAWITNPKIRVWVVAKLCLGFTIKEACNMFFEKTYMADNTYLNIENVKENT